MNKDEIERLLANIPPAAWTENAQQPRQAKPVLWDSDLEPSQAERELQRELLIARVRAERLNLAPRLNLALKTSVEGSQTPCALFLGPTGCGKTSAALWLTAAAPKKSKLVRASELAQADRHHPLGSGVAPEIIESYSVTYLVIDDVGSEGDNVSSIQDVLEHRYARCRATIVTTGLTMDALASHLGRAYLRRILQQHVRRTSDGSEFPVLVVDCHDGPGY